MPDRKEGKVSEFKDSFDIQLARMQCYVSPRVEGIHGNKAGVPHHFVKAGGQCPIKRQIPSGCHPCEYTDLIGRCAFPLPIDELIKRGEVRPWEIGDDE
jgi:hypothetical protein